MNSILKTGLEHYYETNKDDKFKLNNFVRWARRME